MQINVEFHGVLRRLAGMDETTLSVADAAPVSEILKSLEDAVPTLAEILETTACALGDKLIHRSTCLSAGDRLVLIPPVSGG